MTTDDERRRVAERLREYASWDDEGDLVDCQEWGESVLNLLDCGDTESENYAALADLIEPAPKCSEPTPKCDREALLALADELEQETGSVCGVCMGKTARRIREALGVEHG